MFKLRLGHSAEVREFERRVVVVVGLLVTLRAEVDVGKPALVGALFANVHFLKKQINN